MAERFDLEERTTAIGLFNTAQSYWQSALHLEAAQVPVSHPHAAVNFLFCHAIELYLKAYLRAKGFTLSDLKKMRHNIAELASVAKTIGLTYQSSTEELLSHITHEEVAIESRYLVTSFKNIPTSEAFDEAASELDDSIGTALQAVNITVRKRNFEKPLPKGEQDELQTIEAELSELSEQKREIIAYLLHHNQRMFECAWDGGHAKMLISRGIVQSAQRTGQIVDAENVPMEIPRPIWNMLKKHANEFPYTGLDDDPYPWRVDWMLR